MSGVPSGQQSIAYITQLGTGYAPIASGLTPSGNSAMQGMPFLNSGSMQGKLLSAFVAPYFQGMLSKAGMTGMGIGHDQNLYDRLVASNANAEIASQVRAASELDRSNYMRTMQGFASLAGVPFGGQQRLAANRLADLAVTYAPTLINSDPDLLDKLSGSRGSAAVLAQRLANSGRYRLDPVTGRMGADPAATQNLTQGIMRDFYSQDNIASMKGVTAGQLGGLYEQLSLRGMVAGAEFGRTGMLRNLESAVPQQELIQRAQQLGVKGIRQTNGKLDLSDLSANDLESLTKDDAVAAKLRNFDSNRVKASLKAYVNAISAMRDIFGDAGKPNAPVQELMQALEGMSTGAMGQVDPQRLGQMVRQTYYLAKTAGISADAAGLMQRDAAVRGQQLGIEAPFAMVATQNSLAYNAALRSRGVLATPVFGGMSESQLTQMNTSLVQQGVASSLGTRLGTLYRLQDLAGTEKTKDTDLSRVLEAVKTNQKTATLASGRTISIANMTNEDVEQLGASAGFDRGNVQNMLRQTHSSRQALFENPNAVNYIREVAQPQDVSQRLGLGTNVILRSFAMRRGIKNDAELGELNNVSTKIIESLMSSPDFVTASPKERTKAIASVLKEQLPQAAREKIFSGMNAQQQETAITGLAADISGNLDVVAKEQMNAGNAANLFRAMNPSLLAEGSSRQLNESLRNQAREALSGISSGSALRNAVDALRDVDINDSNAFKKVIGRTFGGVDNRRIGDALRQPMQNVINAQKELDKLQTTINLTSDPQAKRNLLDKYEQTRKTLEQHANELTKVGETIGAYSATGLTESDIVSSQNSAKTAARAQRNILVAQADDTKITKEQFETEKTRLETEAKENNQNITFDEKQIRNFIIERRRATSAIKENEIKEYMTNAGVSRDTAIDILKAEQAAERIGISDKAINERMALNLVSKDDIANYARISGVSQDNAKTVLVAEAREKGIIRLMNEKKISKDEATAEFDREARQTAIYDEVKARRDAPEILAKKMAKFKTSQDAISYADTVKAAEADEQNVIQRGLDTQTVKTHGVGVAADARELQTIKQERQNLIDKHGKGDINTFMLTADPEIVKKFNVLNEKAEAVQTRMSDRFNRKGAYSDALFVPGVDADEETTPLTSLESVKTQEREREALRMLGLQSKSNLDANNKKLFEQRVSDLGSIEKLTKSDVEAIDQYSRVGASGKLPAVSLEKLKPIAERLNVNVEDLSRIRSLDKEVMSGLDQERDLFTATSQTLAERLKTTFNLKDDAVKPLTESLTTFSARNRAANLIMTEDRLKSAALKGGQDVTNLKSDYEKALLNTDKDFTLDKFKEKYKLHDADDFNRTVVDLTTYDTSNLRKFKEEGGAKELMKSLKIYDDSTVKNTEASKELNIAGSMTGEFKITDGNVLTSMGPLSMNARSSAMPT